MSARTFVMVVLESSKLVVSLMTTCSWSFTFDGCTVQLAITIGFWLA